MLEWKRLLVDGAHWNGMKKLKKPDRSGKTGQSRLVGTRAVAFIDREVFRQFKTHELQTFHEVHKSLLFNQESGEVE